jgi:erythromycin esterase-like protein
VPRRTPADPVATEALFSALRNAHSVANAEEYFRILHAGNASSWNARDRRMSEGLQDVERHVGAITGQPGRVVVWAHNTHVGDARQTEPGAQGELNLGQLTRERLGTHAVSVGFLTHRGTVLAAPEWGAPERIWTLRPALAGSFSDLLHAVGATDGPPDFLLTFGAGAVTDTLARERLERAVGVVYAPATERQSHYFHARLSRQFDAVVFLDVTSAVTPLTGR